MGFQSQRLLGDSSGTGIPVDERLKMGEGAAAWSLPVLERRIIPGTTSAQTHSDTPRCPPPAPKLLEKMGLPGHGNAKQDHVSPHANTRKSW
eukprot:676443-Amphidinium_carterae.1